MLPNRRRSTLSQKEELVPGLNAAIKRNFKNYADCLDIQDQRYLCEFLRLRGDDVRPNAEAFAAVLRDIELMETIKEMTAAALFESGADDKMADFCLELIDMTPQLVVLRKLRLTEDIDEEVMTSLLEEFMDLGIKYMNLNEKDKQRLKMIGPKVRPLFLDFGFASSIKFLLEHFER
ncbi:unnamed protein product [Bursaphelenchus okinawaensis]|uniref:Uncharacterized protein n=1 Tax=Bursaphelenchus okinawaensis TaxID=465554 RepID=A0A811LSK5_9BILA|nr:unnamed protein product [Bursaphelenchus okinawaensis]CAG9127715.1 unnamed protein product [Bursaphelenchus okinawaensis]